MGRRVLMGLLLLAACAAPPAPETTPAVPQQQPATGTVYVTATTLNVREDSSSNARVVTQVRRGAAVTVIDTAAGWTKVRLANGDTGWVSSDFVSATRPGKLRRGCPADSEFAFVKPPLAAFSEGGPHGLVVVDAMVNTSGEVTATKVISNSTGEDAMAKMAEREIRSARFTPPYRNCVPRSFIFTYKRTF